MGSSGQLLKSINKYWTDVTRMRSENHNHYTVTMKAFEGDKHESLF